MDLGWGMYWDGWRLEWWGFWLVLGLLVCGFLRCLGLVRDCLEESNCFDTWRREPFWDLTIFEFGLLLDHRQALRCWYDYTVMVFLHYWTLVNPQQWQTSAIHYLSTRTLYLPTEFSTYKQYHCESQAIWPMK